MTNKINKILIVEDEQLLLKAIEKSFKKEGYEVHTATNGQDGYDMAAEIKPDLILMDIIMPIKDGLSMLRDIRANEWGRDLKVIALTNLNTYAGYGEETEEYNITDYLVKTDWSVDDLVKRAKEILDS